MSKHLTPTQIETLAYLHEHPAVSGDGGITYRVHVRIGEGGTRSKRLRHGTLMQLIRWGYVAPAGKDTNPHRRELTITRLGERALEAEVA